MTTYPVSTDPLNALTRGDGTTAAHSDDHSRIINAPVNARKYLLGNGTTEDPAAVAALVAAAAGGTGSTVRRVTWPAGTYALPDGVGIDLTDGVQHFGHGRRTVITVKDAYAFLSPNGSSTETRVDGFTINTRSGSTTGGAVKYRAGIHTSARLNDIYAAGVTTLTTPMFYLGGLIGAHLEECDGGTAPVAFYWAPDGSYCNANSMRRCRGVAATNANTFSGVNGGLYADAATNLNIRDSIFESNYNGFGIYGNVCVNMVLDANWFEANDNDNVRLVDSQYCNLQYNKFHYNNGGTPAAVHIKMTNALGAGRHESHVVLGNHYQDASTSGTTLSIGSNVEQTTVIGGDVTLSDSGTNTVVIGYTATTLPGPLGKLKVQTARTAAASGGGPTSAESVFSVVDSGTTNYFMVGSRGVPIFRTGDESVITGTDELQTRSFALYWDNTAAKVKARVRDSTGAYATHILSN